jgi:hypothetical protein
MGIPLSDFVGRFYLAGDTFVRSSLIILTLRGF